MLYIGVDLGTSAVKLLMMDGNGNIAENCIKRISIIFSIPGLVSNRIHRIGLQQSSGRNKRTDI